MTKAKNVAYVVFAAAALLACALNLKAEEPAKDKPAEAAQEIGMPAITQAIHRITLENWTPKKFEQLAVAVSQNPPYAYYVMALTQWMVNNYDSEKIKEESWCSMVGLQRWCTFLHAHRADLKDLDQRFVTYIMSNRDFTENFFEVYSSKDDLNNVMRLLQEFYLQRKDTFPKYNKLAIALAIVWDQPPSAKPHGQVPDSAVVPNDDTDLQRYDFWVKSNEHGDIDCNFTKTDPVYIKFIINAPAPISELEWAQKHTHYTRTRLGNAYGSIHYVYERVEKSQFSWPHEVYSLRRSKSAAASAATRPTTPRPWAKPAASRRCISAARAESAGTPGWDTSKATTTGIWNAGATPPRTTWWATPRIPRPRRTSQTISCCF